MGVRIVTDEEGRGPACGRSSGNFDAVFIAIGAGVGKHVEIPARDAVRVLDAISLVAQRVRQVIDRLGWRVDSTVGEHGNGRGADRQRLGAEDALIVYRRDRAHMAARDFEADEAVEEGVKIKWLTTIKEITGPRLPSRSWKLDAGGRPSPQAGSMPTPTRLCWRLGRRRRAVFFHRYRVSTLERMEW